MPEYLYYPPPPAVATTDPIDVVATVGRAMAKHMAPRARDPNRVDS